MNYNFLSIPKSILGFIIPLILLCPWISFAQSSEFSKATKSQIFTQKDLDAINQAPIAPKVYASDRIKVTPGRDDNFTYQDNSGTKIEESRDIGQNVDIQVNSSMGTHYQMMPLGDKDNVSSRQTIDRVPSIQLPF